MSRNVRETQYLQDRNQSPRQLELIAEYQQRKNHLIKAGSDLEFEFPFSSPRSPKWHLANPGWTEAYYFFFISVLGTTTTAFFVDNVKLEQR